MSSNPMKAMQNCLGHCDQVPDEVCDAVFDSVRRIPRVTGKSDERDARAVILASRMALEGWRFCPCFALTKTPGHQEIFNMVHTNLANKLAHTEARAKAGSGIQVSVQSTA